MKLLFSCSCLLVILLQAILASTFASSKHATLNSKEPWGSKIKKIVYKLVWKRNLQSATKKNKRARKTGKGGVVLKKNEPESLSKILPKTLVKVVIDYLSDTYSILVSKNCWVLKDQPEIEVDSARLYVIAKDEGITGLNHSPTSRKKGKCHSVEFYNHQWSHYWRFTSSHDGRYVSFSYQYDVSVFFGILSKASCSVKWLAQNNKPEDGGFKHITFDSEGSTCGLVSRDGRMLCSYSEASNTTRVYQIMEKAGEDPAAFMKFELTGKPRSISGNSDRVMMDTAGQLEIREIGKDADRLVCRINARVLFYTSALNEDGSEAAFFNNGELLIVQVNEVVGDKVYQPAIISVHVPESWGEIAKLVYSDENKLHVLHKGGTVLLFDPPTKTLVPIEALEEGQKVIDSTISPNADYIAAIRFIGEKGVGGKIIHETVVKRKLGSADWKNLFGYDADKVNNSKQAKSPAEERQ